MQTGGSAPMVHISSIDGLRGVAVAAVVTYHFAPSVLPGGFIGVDVFFVLSGFLMSSLLLREHTAAGNVNLGRFFVRRVRRLLPALLLMLLAVSMYAAVWADDIELARLRRHGVATLAYIANWVFIHDGTTYTDVLVGASPLRHAWSLAIEEQFYIFIAIAIVTVGALGAAHRLRLRIGVGAAVLAGISAIWMATLSFRGADTARTYFGTDTRAHALLIGVVLGAVLLGRAATSSLMIRVAGIVGAAVLVTVAVIGSEDALWMHRGGFFLVSIAAAAVIVGTASDQWMSWALGFRPLVLLGLISYGVYLWHWPVLVIFDQQRVGVDGFGLLAFQLGLTLVLAILSYVVVEQPIRSGALGRAYGRRSILIGPAVTLGSVALLVAATVVPDTLGDGPAGPPPENAVPSVATGSPPAALGQGDAAEGAVSQQLSGDSAGDGPVRLAFLGDSVAHTLIGGELSGLLDSVPWTADQTSFDTSRVEIVALARPACSFLPGDVVINQPGGSYEHASLSGACEGWEQDLASAAAEVDVVALLLTTDLEDRWIDGEFVGFGSELYVQWLTEFLDEVHGITESAGVTLTLVATAPRATPGWSDPVGEREARVAGLYRTYAESLGGVTVIDLGDVVCPDADCSSSSAGFDPAGRHDGLHYTAAGAQWVANWMTPMFETQP